MDTHIIVLLVVFIAIFVATAALTLCALPGWIKIPDTYLKILFSSLLLEVIACILLVFRGGLFDNEKDIHKCEDKLSLNKAHSWVILNEDGLISQLSVNETVPVGINDSSFSEKAKKSAIYHLVYDSNDYLVKNQFNQYLGKVPQKVIKNIFNNIISTESEFRYIQYTQNANGKWNPDNILPKEWSLRLNRFTVWDDESKNDTTYYNKPVGSLDLGDRETHVFTGSDGANYVVRITDAFTMDNTKQHFVKFIIIRTYVEAKFE